LCIFFRQQMPLLNCSLQKIVLYYNLLKKIVEKHFGHKIFISNSLLYILTAFGRNLSLYTGYIPGKGIQADFQDRIGNFGPQNFSISDRIGKKTDLICLLGPARYFRADI
jgi:hypothetical protein